MTLVNGRSDLYQSFLRCIELMVSLSLTAKMPRVADWHILELKGVVEGPGIHIKMTIVFIIRIVLLAHMLLPGPIIFHHISHHRMVG